MVSHDSSFKRQTMPAPAWRRHGLVALLGVMMLLFSAMAAAHVTTDSGHPATGSLSSPVTLAALTDEEPGDPTCHPGHGLRLTLSTILRTAPPELDPGPALPGLVASNTPPAVPVATGIPRGLPEADRLPLYLLTQRIRS
jgi:hypothetical protein